METLSSEYLFEVRPDGKQALLDKGRSTVFHRAVAQRLFVSPRARKDIQTTIAFLITRVRDPDEDG